MHHFQRGVDRDSFVWMSKNNNNKTSDDLNLTDRSLSPRWFEQPLWTYATSFQKGVKMERDAFCGMQLLKDISELSAYPAKATVALHACQKVKTPPWNCVYKVVTSCHVVLHDDLPESAFLKVFTSFCDSSG